MSILGWAVVGLLAGGLGRRILGEDKRGCLATMAVGLVGSFIGGGLYRLWSGERFDDDFDLASIGVAVLGAVVFLLVLRAIGGRKEVARR